ncbi:MAG: hypothetical protein HYS57_00175 [Parcubacteria group bacterium]|nr:hypothetical protein [Parcubacteria group bacterium]
MNIGYYLRFILLPFQRRYTAKICGHQAKRVGVVRAFGCKRVITIRGEPEYCYACPQQAAIQCAFCGKAIFPTEEPITLTIHDTLDRFKQIRGIKVLREKPFHVVGCMRITCSDSAADRAGFWVMPGRVEAANIYDAAVSLRDGEGISVNDVGSISEARDMRNRSARSS